MERMKYLLQKAQERLANGQYIDGDFIEDETITLDEAKTIWDLMSASLLIMLNNLK